MNELEDAYDTIVAETFDAIAAVLDDCDDTTVNAVPDAPGVNSVFALVTHLDGVIADWGGNLVAGEGIPRDRDAEFTATGTVAQARVLLDRMRERLPRYVHLALTRGITDRDVTIASTRPGAADATPEFAVLHLLRELTQHTGHLQICRDLVCPRAL
ncbi:MAG: DinB family protein [Gordonia sp. (in: high G+C Gram-positive bacteria)]|uniref:DinB family protein n=1 Tax=Gordonia sp. (in: high G+C Gram-positive bacteria) TaxID=84139 RepID=UPI0039E56E05